MLESWPGAQAIIEFELNTTASQEAQNIADKKLRYLGIDDFSLASHIHSEYPSERDLKLLLLPTYLQEVASFTPS